MHRYSFIKYLKSAEISKIFNHLDLDLLMFSHFSVQNILYMTSLTLNKTMKHAFIIVMILMSVLSESMIEEVNDRQLEKLIEENDFVAVAWFTKTCKYNIQHSTVTIQISNLLTKLKTSFPVLPTRNKIGQVFSTEISLRF